MPASVCTFGLEDTRPFLDTQGFHISGHFIGSVDMSESHQALPTAQQSFRFEQFGQDLSQSMQHWAEVGNGKPAYTDTLQT